jgi:NAD-dependent SIR2 family protein deacetylase
MPQKKRRIFFLGAGASVRDGIPLTRNFIPYLFENGHKDHRLKRARTFISDFFSTGISITPALYPRFEQVMSFLDMAISQDHYLSSKYHHKYLRQIRSDMVYLIWHLIKSRGSEESETYQCFAEKLSPDDLIISLNYDTLLESALLKSHGNINYGINFSCIYSSVPLQEGAPTPLLLKLHGSVNWLYCPNCEALYCYTGTKAIERIFQGKNELCPYDNCYLKGIIIPPTEKKDYGLPLLALMWIKASKLLRTTTAIDFIGYSLNEIDMQVLYLLKRSLFNNTEKPKLRVIDPDPSGIVFDRYEKLFGPVEKKQCYFEEYVKEIS